MSVAVSVQPAQRRLPTPRACTHRPVDPQMLARSRAAGLSQLQARIVAARLAAQVEDVRSFLWPTSRDLYLGAPQAALSAAAQRLASALVSAERMHVLARADAQGVYAQALCANAFIHRAVNPNLCVQVQFGAGLDVDSAQRLLCARLRPAVLLVCALTASAPAALAQLYGAGIDVIVIDAQRALARTALTQAFVLQPAAGVPLSAPLLLWQLLAHAESALRGANATSGAGRALLDLVAAALLEEGAPLTVPAHRSAVRYGLLELTHTQRPCWQVLEVAGPASAQQLRVQPALTIEALNASLRVRAGEHPQLALNFLCGIDQGELGMQLALLNLDRRARELVQACLADALAPGALQTASARSRAAAATPIPRYLSDGILMPQELNLGTFDELRRLEPHGAGFEAACFDGRFKVLSIQPLPHEPEHLALILLAGEVRVAARWLNASGAARLPAPGSYAHFLYRLGALYASGARQLQLQIQTWLDAPTDARELAH